MRRDVVAPQILLIASVEMWDELSPIVDELGTIQERIHNTHNVSPALSPCAVDSFSPVNTFPQAIHWIVHRGAYKKGVVIHQL